MLIRDGCEEDLPRIQEIYNHYIEHSHATFDLECQTLSDRREWFARFDETGPYRLFVVETSNAVEGFASSSRFHERLAYGRSVATSVYLAPESCASGLGSALYDRLLERLTEEPGVHRAYGGVALPNEGSVALHQKFGFKQVALYSEVGFKFGRYWDVAWFERSL